MEDAQRDVIYSKMMEAKMERMAYVRVIQNVFKKTARDAVYKQPAKFTWRMCFSMFIMIIRSILASLQRISLSNYTVLFDLLVKQIKNVFLG